MREPPPPNISGYIFYYFLSIYVPQHLNAISVFCLLKNLSHKCQHIYNHLNMYQPRLQIYNFWPSGPTSNKTENLACSLASKLRQSETTTQLATESFSVTIYGDIFKPVKNNIFCDAGLGEYRVFQQKLLLKTLLGLRFEYYNRYWPSLVAQCTCNACAYKPISCQDTHPPTQEKPFNVLKQQCVRVPVLTHIYHPILFYQLPDSIQPTSDQTCF